MKNVKQLRNFIEKREDKLKKTFEWVVLLGNLVLLIFKFSMM
ncbi:hypothetical protein ABKP09_25900 [Peribacillus frigoritolerans]